MDNHETKAPPTGYQQFIADHKDEIREIWKKVLTEKNCEINFFVERWGKCTRRTEEDHVHRSSFSWVGSSTSLSQSPV